MVFFLNILPFIYFAILLIGPFVWVFLQATPPLDILLGMGRRSFFFNLFWLWPAMMFLAYSVFSFLFALDTWAAGNMVRPFGGSYFFDDLSFWEIFTSTLAFFVEYPFSVCIILAELFVGKFEYPLFEPQVVTGIEYGFVFGGNEDKFANVFSTFLFWNIPFVYFSKVMLVAYSKVFSGRRPSGT